jgi:DNA-binding transcriptional LysR family regulator
MNRLFEAEAFVLVVEEGSFTSAARCLGITKSYASKLVTRLEDRLGVRLLQRTTRKLSLTDPGRAYYERCTDVMRALEDAESEATWLQTAPRGRLRVTLPNTFGVTYLAGPLAEFKVRYPELTVEAIFTDRQVDLLAEGFDVAVRAGEKVPPGLTARRLVNVDMAVCASEAYLARRGAPEQPEDLVGHECLLYAYHAVPGTWKLKGPRGQVAINVSGTLIANHGSVLIHAATRGLGILFMPVFHTAPHLRDGRLVSVLPEWRWPIAIHAVFPNARHLSAKVRVFVDFLVEHFRAPPWAGWDA